MSAAAPTNKWLVALSVTFGTLMGVIDATVVNIALPHIRGSLGATIQEIAWIVTAYTTANVCVMPLTGFLGRRFGQKRVYMASLCLFLVSSVFCGLAESLPLLVAMRVLQGAGAGALLPTEQAILQHAFPPSEQGMAMAIFSMTVMLGPAIGPTLGGLLVDHLSWPWVFYVNLPIGLLGLVLVSRYVHIPAELQASKAAPGGARAGVDWSGILLLLVSLMGLQLLLAEGNEWGWTEPLTLALALTIMLGLLAFAFRELTTPGPAVHVELFREPVFFFGTLMGGVLYAMVTANLFLAPVLMQETLGFTATEAAMALIPRVAVSAVATLVLGRYYNKLPPKAVLAMGTLAFGMSCFFMGGLNLEASSLHIALILAVQGIGFGGINVTLNTLAISQIPKHQKVDANGLHALVRQTSGSIGVAFFAALLTRQSIISRAGLIPQVVPGRTEVMQHLGGLETRLSAQGVGPGALSSMSLGMLEDTVQRHASMLAFNTIFLIVGGLFVAALPLALFLRRQPPSPTT
ncbi:MAG: multidrug efflux MFS transporter [Myxococcaceae bacterium]|nr:multidrug efflux MFS transporter [Myxococcaceae bacterium]